MRTNDKDRLVADTGASERRPVRIEDTLAASMEGRKLKQRFPKMVRVGPRYLKLRKEKGLSFKADVTGVAGVDMQKIYIDADLGKEAEQDTVLHELLHAVWNQTTLEKAFTAEQEEMVLHSISPWILMLLKDNPELVDYLIGPD